MMEGKNNWKAWLYLAPLLILMAVFTFYPLFSTVITSFKIDYNYMTGAFSRFGIDYYISVLKHPRFLTALKNTMIMTFVSVPLAVIIALLISVGLNSIKRLQGFYQTIFFLPYVTNVIAIGLVFSVMFHQDYGVINAFLKLFGINPVNWKGAGAGYWEAMTVVMVYTIWKSLPFKIMVFLSGLQSINKNYYQAAQVDATPRWRVFTRITVPLLSPMIMYITITSFIGAFKAYETVKSLFPNGGPAGNARALITIVWLIYDSLNNTTPGYISFASAASVILFFIILVFTVIQLQINKYKVHY